MEATSVQRRRLAEVPMPPRIALLPRSREGYPIPWFVPELPDGTRDVRVMGEDQWIAAVRDHRCWVCGQTLGKWKTFLIGPMCTINRITAEPPGHRDCMEYSAQVCPFVSRPEFVRRPAALPENSVQPAGMHDDRNPGIAVTWTTKSYEVFRVPFGMGRPGRLIDIGLPSAVEWWREGRLATPAAAMFALENGLVKLRDIALDDKNPEAAIELLERQYQAARTLVPV